mmetsp:Transcript_19364/g.28630  ORF Transcript_19364/g.28630 Transcript_19364/m.28630 type:complete len:372 (+) Transcript_19364:130-1245(+)
MDFSNQLFESPPIGVDGVLAQGYHIFAAYWMPLVIITCLRILAISGTMAILAGFTVVVAMTYITMLVNFIKNIMPDNSRYLLDYSVGVSGASRLLDAPDNYYKYYTDDQIGDDDLPKIAAIGIITIISLVVLWVIMLSLVTSTFDGAMYHALAQIYAGGAPTPINSVKRGFAKKWNVYGFKLLFSCAIIGLTLVVIGLAALFQASFSLIFASYLVYVICFVLLSTVCVAAIPAIVVEGISAVQGFKRSLILCKKFICFIFCSELGYRVIFIIAATILNLIFGELGTFLEILGHFAVSIAFSSIKPIFAFVLYMSMRIRSENITRDEFAEERSHDYDSDYGSLPFATAQELVIVEALAQHVDTELPAYKELV